jgi:hypothetical protein
MMERLSSLWNTVKQWVQKKVQSVLSWVEDHTVKHIHAFIKKENVPAGEYTIQRSVGGFVGGYLGAMLALNAGVPGFVIAAGLLTLGGWLLHKAHSYEPAVV